MTEITNYVLKVENVVYKNKKFHFKKEDNIYKNYVED